MKGESQHLGKWPINCWLSLWFFQVHTMRHPVSWGGAGISNAKRVHSFAVLLQIAR
jgi:hypothetical protein